MMKRSTVTQILTLGLAAAGLYRYRRQLLAGALGLPPARFKVGVERNIPVTMPDGVQLMTDHYYPKAPGKFPTILMRSVYGRGWDTVFPVNLGLVQLCKLFAERGYHVVTQTTRGRFDSGGDFEPFVDARADGLATLDWIACQAWFDGSVGMWGNSYNGYVQWAVAADAPPYLKAIFPITITSDVPNFAFPQGAMAMDTALLWLTILYTMSGQNRRAPLKTAYGLSAVGLRRAISPALDHLPVSEADRLILGEPFNYYDEWCAHPDAADPYWQRIDLSSVPARATVPVHLLSGWYDIFLDGLLRDYAELKNAGRAPYLTIGPWTHTSAPGLIVNALREGLIWFEAQLKGDDSQLREKPVRIYVMGADEWREMDDWPPPSRSTRYYLRAQGVLTATLPSANERPDHYHYDPTDPTPNLGGPLLMPPSGALDNRPLEARPDVLTYTTPVLTRDVEIMGPIKLELYVRSSLDYTDFFGRLCDVYPDGRSINICDGLFRICPGRGDRQPEGSLRLEIDLLATAQRFKRGHRIRLQVSSGAHPRWSRNLGTGEPVTSGTAMRAADQTIYHDAAHPSALVLPVV
jgi:uncharacterized protein